MTVGTTVGVTLDVLLGTIWEEALEPAPQTSSTGHFTSLLCLPLLFILHIDDGQQRRKTMSSSSLRALSHNNEQEHDNGGLDWTLSGFGATPDILFVVLYALYFLLIYFLWWRTIGKTQILKPLKLLAVFIHEFGHVSYQLGCAFSSCLLLPFGSSLTNNNNDAICVLQKGSAAVLTCGKMKSIKVNEDETGYATFTGGWSCCTIPGGYVGGGFWAAAFVAMSGHRIAATVAAGLLSFALMISLL